VASPRGAAATIQGGPGHHGGSPREAVCAFDRIELMQILDLYGRQVAAGEWRDYSIDFERDRAVFSIFRRTSEMPLFRIEKCPRLARKQGAYSVIAAGGQVLKRGHDLARVIAILAPKVQVVV
jgi:hypothetical protein